MKPKEETKYGELSDPEESLLFSTSRTSMRQMNASVDQSEDHWVTRARRLLQEFEENEENAKKRAMKVAEQEEGVATQIKKRKKRKRSKSKSSMLSNPQVEVANISREENSILVDTEDKPDPEPELPPEVDHTAEIFERIFSSRIESNIVKIIRRLPNSAFNLETFKEAVFQVSGLDIDEITFLGDLFDSATSYLRTFVHRLKYLIVSRCCFGQILFVKKTTGFKLCLTERKAVLVGEWQAEIQRKITESASEEAVTEANEARTNDLPKVVNTQEPSYRSENRAQEEDVGTEAQIEPPAALENDNCRRLSTASPPGFEDSHRVSISPPPGLEPPGFERKEKLDLNVDDEIYIDMGAPPGLGFNTSSIVEQEKEPEVIDVGFPPGLCSKASASNVKEARNVSTESVEEPAPRKERVFKIRAPAQESWSNFLLNSANEVANRITQGTAPYLKRYNFPGAKSNTKLNERMERCKAALDAFRREHIPATESQSQPSISSSSEATSSAVLKSLPRSRPGSPCSSNSPVNEARNQTIAVMPTWKMIDPTTDAISSTVVNERNDEREFKEPHSASTQMVFIDSDDVLTPSEGEDDVFEPPEKQEPQAVVEDEVEIEDDDGVVSPPCEEEEGIPSPPPSEDDGVLTPPMDDEDEKFILPVGIAPTREVEEECELDRHASFAPLCEPESTRLLSTSIDFNSADEWSPLETSTPMKNSDNEMESVPKMASPTRPIGPVLSNDDLIETITMADMTLTMRGCNSNVELNDATRRAPLNLSLPLDFDSDVDDTFVNATMDDAMLSRSMRSDEPTVIHADDTVSRDGRDNSTQLVPDDSITSCEWHSAVEAKQEDLSRYDVIEEELEVDVQEAVQCIVEAVASREEMDSIVDKVEQPQLYNPDDVVTPSDDILTPSYDEDDVHSPTEEDDENEEEIVKSLLSEVVESVSSERQDEQDLVQEETDIVGSSNDDTMSMFCDGEPLDEDAKEEKVVEQVMESMLEAIENDDAAETVNLEEDSILNVSAASCSDVFEPPTEPSTSPSCEELKVETPMTPLRSLSLTKSAFLFGNSGARAAEPSPVPKPRSIFGFGRVKSSSGRAYDFNNNCAAGDYEMSLPSPRARYGSTRVVNMIREELIEPDSGSSSSFTSDDEIPSPATTPPPTSESSSAETFASTQSDCTVKSNGKVELPVATPTLASPKTKKVATLERWFPVIRKTLGSSQSVDSSPTGLRSILKNHLGSTTSENLNTTSGSLDSPLKVRFAIQEDPTSSSLKDLDISARNRKKFSFRRYDRSNRGRSDEPE